MNGRGQILTAATVTFIAAVVAITAVALSIEDGARAATMIGLITTPLVTLVGFFALFVKQEETSATVTEIAEKATNLEGMTYDLANGGGDAKLRDAVRTVIRDELVDPKAVEQLDKDRARLKAVNAAADLLARREGRAR